MNVFVLFWDWNDVGLLPDCWNRVCVECEVVEVCEILCCEWAQVFQVSNVDVVRAK